ncbi:MAG TPA: hypothetical protein VN667_16660 [Burkholderiales bacterium]|nr:hypothetical protein [Burkholderiales bacterium]
MKPETKVKLQDGFLTLIAGVILSPAVGFGFGLWTTTAKSEGRVNEAVTATQAAICVAQFSNAPNHEQQLVKFKALDYSAKGEFFEKGGWSKMPGQEKAQSAVTEACSSRLDALAQK